MPPSMISALPITRTTGNRAILEVNMTKRMIKNDPKNARPHPIINLKNLKPPNTTINSPAITIMVRNPGVQLNRETASAGNWISGEKWGKWKFPKKGKWKPRPPVISQNISSIPDIMNLTGHPPFFKIPSDQDLVGNNLFYEFEAVCSVVYEQTPLPVLQRRLSYNTDMMVYHLIVSAATD